MEGKPAAGCHGDDRRGPWPRSIAMPRRRLVLGAGALVLLGLASWLLPLTLFRPETPGVTPGNFRRLQFGMSMQDAERVLGGPGEMTASFGPLCERWQGHELTIYLYFDLERGLQDGSMEFRSGTAERLQERTGFLDRLRRAGGVPGWACLGPPASAVPSPGPSEIPAKLRARRSRSMQMPRATRATAVLDQSPIARRWAAV
jgi:hypothetical protein